MSKSEQGPRNICPRCKNPTLRSCVDGKSIFLRCTRCDGAYFSDEEDFERFAKHILHEEGARCFMRWFIMSMEGAEANREGKRLCPLCRRSMRQHPFGLEPYCFVVLDRCEFHGLWLDKSEIEAVLKGLAQAAKPPAR